MEEFEVVVPNRIGEYGYPYIAGITGHHPKFVFARSFIPYDNVQKLPDGKVYTMLLPDKGIYECCIRYWDRETKKLISRDREWFLLNEGDAFSIDYGEIEEALAHFSKLLARCTDRDCPRLLS